MLLPSECSIVPSPTDVRRVIARFQLGGLFTILYAPVRDADSGWDGVCSVVGREGHALGASPSFADPNFHQAVVLIVEHGPDGTLGLVLNRSTKVLLSEALPTSLCSREQPPYLLFRLSKPPANTRSVFGGVYVGGTRGDLERIIRQPKPTETFRAFAGYASWAPRQLEAEMHQGAWATIRPDAVNLFDQDPGHALEGQPQTPSSSEGHLQPVQAGTLLRAPPWLSCSRTIISDHV